MEDEKRFQQSRRDQFLEMAKLADNETDRLSLMYKAIGAQQSICRLDDAINRPQASIPTLTSETSLEDACDFWTVRIGNVLKNEIGWRLKDFTIADLLVVSRTKMLKWPNFGRKSLKIIEDDLMANGLSLAP